MYLLPGVQVFDLFLDQQVDVRAQGLKLDASDLSVNFGGHRVDSLLQLVRDPDRIGGAGSEQLAIKSITPHGDCAANQSMT